jgi:O-antigen/teichoic acid export membrane protein
MASAIGHGVADSVIDGQDQIKRGLLWLGSATIAARLLDVGATITVVGLLSKEQMGLASLALSACAILESVSGLGIGTALVQAKELSRDEESSLFWITSAGGLGLSLILLGLAPVLTATYAEPRLGPLLAVSALKLALAGLSVVPMQLLSKALQFREIGTVQTLSSLGEGVTKIAFALGGAGAWALVLGNVARGLVLLIAVLAFSRFRPRLHYAGREVQRFLGFGLKVAGSSILYQVYKNSDYFLVGKLLGIEALGLYRVAFDVAMQPTEAIIIVVGRVGFPVYARLSSNLAALRATFLSNTRSIFLLTAPVAAVIFFAAHPLLDLLGDGRWAAAVPAVHVLVWAGLLRSATTMFSPVYVALGKPEYSTLESLITLVILTSSFWLGLSYFPEWGVMSVCYAWVLITPLLLGGHVALMRHLIALPAAAYSKSLLAGIGPVPLIVVGLLLIERVTSLALPGALHLILLAVVALLLHWAYLQWVLRVRFSDLLPKRRPAPVPAEVEPTVSE